MRCPQLQIVSFYMFKFPESSSSESDPKMLKHGKSNPKRLKLVGLEHSKFGSSSKDS